MFINKRNVNLVIRFLLELCALVSLGYWGFQVGKSVYTKFVFLYWLTTHVCDIMGSFHLHLARIPLLLSSLELLIFTK
ncbi:MULTISPECIES: YrdB family protein [Bacillus cereus group]|uniref:YrdB family protein n=1 Tax=Bacillus cereus group TaxID=86661 RepID=UPI001F0A89C9|nr:MULTISPECIES: YrdB family protein [Bacillus cereus group]